MCAKYHCNVTLHGIHDKSILNIFLHLQTVGCDGIVGSGAVMDRCGVCAGKNRDCQTISGIYTRASLPFGYTLITRIPEGACSINITELGTSRNYLGIVPGWNSCSQHRNDVRKVQSTNIARNHKFDEQRMIKHHNGPGCLLNING